MENRILISEMDCYLKASQEQQKKVNPQWDFDLTKLPTEGMRSEMRQFVEERGKTIALMTMVSERNFYDRICRFLKEKNIRADSFQEKTLEEWIKKLNAWLMQQGQIRTIQGMSVYGKEKNTPSNIITYFRKIYYFTKGQDTRHETEKDVWDLSKIDVSYKQNPVKNFETLNFSEIIQPAIKEEVKKAVFRHLQYAAIATISKELTAVRRLSKYLDIHYPKVKSCNEIRREILEEYLIYLQTEDTGVNNFRSDLTKLRAVLETVGKIYGYSHLEQLFLNTDIPHSTRSDLKSYSDEELKRFNAVFVKMEEQMCRLMVIHQMLGTRISDTLTLQTDCLYEQEGRPMIRIQQMKTNTFVKPISAELELLIQKAIQYTRKMYGETKFIFVNERDPERPMQYNTVQNRVMAMIQKENLRDDKGQIFGFGTHMFRHCYGIRLTEMHYDDWTIAKLLGHRSIKNVKYYRQMSLQIVADETREVRERKSRLIEKYLDGWCEEYEQLRQHD